MYFGALAAGADLAAGVTAVNEIQKSGEKFSFAFKSLSANFQNEQKLRHILFVTTSKASFRSCKESPSNTRTRRRR